MHTAHPSGAYGKSARYFCCFRTYLVVDWPLVDLSWSRLGHLGDSVLLHVPFFLQQASLGMFLCQWHGGREQEESHRPLAARLGTGTQSLLLAELRCMTKLRVKKGEIYSSPFMEGTAKLCGKGRVAKLEPLKQLAT